MVSSNANSIKRARNFIKNAIDKDDTATIEKLLKAGFPVDESITEYPKVTALMYAATQGKE